MVNPVTQREQLADLRKSSLPSGEPPRAAPFKLEEAVNSGQMNLSGLVRTTDHFEKEYLLASKKSIAAVIAEKDPAASSVEQKRLRAERATDAIVRRELLRHERFLAGDIDKDQYRVLLEDAHRKLGLEIFDIPKLLQSRSPIQAPRPASQPAQAPTLESPASAPRKSATAFSAGASRIAVNGSASPNTSEFEQRFLGADKQVILGALIGRDSSALSPAQKRLLAGRAFDALVQREKLRHSQYEQGAVSPQSYRAALEALNAKVGVNVFDVEKLVAK